MDNFFEIFRQKVFQINNFFASHGLNKFYNSQA